MGIFTVRNEVVKVMLLQVCVCPGGVVSQHALQVLSQHALQQVSSGGAWSGGVCSGGVSAPRVGWSGEVPCPRGLLLGEASIPACSEAEPHGRDGYCNGWYACHWNAFLFLSKFLYQIHLINNSFFI